MRFTKNDLQWEQIRDDCNMKACGVLTDKMGSPLPGGCKITVVPHSLVADSDPIHKD